MIPKIDPGSALTIDCSFQKKDRNWILNLGQNTVRHRIHPPSSLFGQFHGVVKNDAIFPGV
jgi:hypothetical protein